MAWGAAWGLPQRPSPQLARWYVLRDHGASAGPGAVANFHRGDEHRVDAEEGVPAHACPVLDPAVPVGSDRTRADVRALADLGVADVAHVVLLDPRTEPAVLDLGVVADLGARADVAARAEVAVRADGHAVLDR
jgi:hypothetical protein